MAALGVVGFVVLALTSVTALERHATVVLMRFPTNERVGNLTFTQTDNGNVMINGTLKSLPNGPHGFHIHEKGDLIDGCVSAGGHFNPAQVHHGAPNDSVRHVGDLGNIVVEGGVCVINISDHLISLHGTNSIIGRAVVVHENEDDLGKVNNEGSKTTGNAGSRLACGVIGIQKPLFENAASSLQMSTTALLSAVVFALVKQLAM